MTKILKPLLLCLLITSTFGQIVSLSQIQTAQTQASLSSQYQDSEFLKLINNYFGCKTWNNGACLECSTSYIFNKNGICCLIDQNCQNFNRDMGVCQQCYTGYSVDANGTCKVSTDNQRIGCASWNKNVCQACSAKYYFGANNICLPVSDFCREWNTTTGQCTHCYQGYQLQNGQCLLDNSPSVSASNPLCKEWKDKVCQQCAPRSYFDSNRICQPVKDQCQTWDLQDGLCLTCYKGYQIQNGTCIYSKSNTALVTDPGCKIWNGSVCLECSNRWLFDKTGSCIPINDSCRDFNNNTGVCLTCYPGYTLIQGACQYVQVKLTDTGCTKWDANTLNCSACSQKWIFNQNGICVPVNDACRTLDNKGLCTGCYRGYEVSNGSCIFVNYQTVQDLGCKIWNWSNNTCSECSFWWYLNATSGKCAQVSDLCKTYTNSGLCDSCYKGFDLKDGLCFVSPVAAPSDFGCKTQNQSVCIECSQNWVFNSNKVCVAVSDQCKTHDSDGNCLSCYVGYGVVDGTCQFIIQAVPDQGCKTFVWNTKVCKACSDKYVINSNGNCIAVSDQCRTFDQKTGACTACYRGYDLLTNSSDLAQCILSTNNLAITDLGCKIWNWNQQICTECSQGWYFQSGKCVIVSPYCKSSDSTSGQCLTCYLGYDLSEANCVYSPSNTAPPTDVGCKTWKNSVCTECSHNWEFNIGKTCVPVSDLCKTHQDQLCTSCFNGYVLVNGTCQISPLNSIIPTDAGCKNWDWNSQKCLECSAFWYFNNDVCTPVNDFCKTYDSTTGLCLSCFKGYSLVNGTCNVQDARAVSDVGCGKWDWDNNKCLSCSNQWYFNIEGVCTPVSHYCKTYDTATGACTSCFSGYSLSNGVCSVSLTLCKQQNQNGCTSCYNGFALYQKKCISLDNIANIALFYAECCPEKLAQLKADGRIPQ